MKDSYQILVIKIDKVKSVDKAESESLTHYFKEKDACIEIISLIYSADDLSIKIENWIVDYIGKQNTGAQFVSDRYTEIFQETKKIVSAIQSNIHYYEWLPIVVGRTMINRYRLGGYSGHDSNTNPSVL